MAAPKKFQDDFTTPQEGNNLKKQGYSPSVRNFTLPSGTSLQDATLVQTQFNIDLSGMQGSTNTVVTTKQYSSIINHGGGLFYWSSTNPYVAWMSTPDEGIVLQGSGGYWVRIFDQSSIHTTFWGINSNTSDATTQVQAAADASSNFNSTVVLGPFQHNVQNIRFASGSRGLDGRNSTMRCIGGNPLGIIETQGDWFSTTGPTDFVVKDVELSTNTIAQRGIFATGVTRGHFENVVVTASIITEAITGVSTDSNYFQVAGDYTGYLSENYLLEVDGSTGNDGQYTVDTASFSTGTTTINVKQNVANATADGNLKLIPMKDGIRLMWGCDNITFHKCSINGPDYFFDGAAIRVISKMHDDVISLGGRSDTETDNYWFSFGTASYNHSTKELSVSEDTFEQGDSGEIVNVSLGSNYFEIYGDYTRRFTNYINITVAGSTGNDGNYIVTSSSYSSGSNLTRLNVASVPDSTADGYIIEASARVWIDDSPDRYALITEYNNAQSVDLTWISGSDPGTNISGFTGIAHPGNIQYTEDAFCKNITITDSVLDGFKYGASFSRVDDIRIENNYFVGQVRNIHSGAACQSVAINNNLLFTAESTAIHVAGYGGRDWNVTDNVIYGFNSHSGDNAAIEAYVDSRDCKISGNIINGSWRFGIYLGCGLFNITVSENTIKATERGIVIDNDWRDGMESPTIGGLTNPRRNSAPYVTAIGDSSQIFITDNKIISNNFALAISQINNHWDSDYEIKHVIFNGNIVSPDANYILAQQHDTAANINNIEFHNIFWSGTTSGSAPYHLDGNRYDVFSDIRNVPWWDDDRFRSISGATPDVTNGHKFFCSNGGSTTVTSFDGDSQLGKIITVRLDSNTTIQHGSSDIRCLNSIDQSGDANTILQFIKVDIASNIWVQIGATIRVVNQDTLTENSGSIGGTNDGDLPDISTVSGTYTQSEVQAIRDAVREVADAHNDLLTKLENSGIMNS